ncbi:Butyrophilin subfamily 3 member A2 [Platysternon megacephalum]|uniref:Butyrophilin subfamily 3 member A2 n=1 Tax=Platysternon megacephalum TaxID=55544 RepID=A0A4D9DET2_9SAUR|nr:Butyrophilin subfamily 3 member A2 [Platysternon megacephalum]
METTTSSCISPGPVPSKHERPLDQGVNKLKRKRKETAEKRNSPASMADGWVKPSMASSPDDAVVRATGTHLQELPKNQESALRPLTRMPTQNSTRAQMSPKLVYVKPKDKTKDPGQEALAMSGWTAWAHGGAWWSDWGSEERPMYSGHGHGNKQSSKLTSAEKLEDSNSVTADGLWFNTGLCGRLDIREMEDSSMSPGSVRSLPLLGFTIFLISLHIHRLDSVSFKVIGPDRPIRALVGEDALLPCHLSPIMSAESMEVRWFRSTFSAIVHLYRDGRDQVGQQIAPYRSRTKLLKDGIANGTVSLRIHNITPSDEGTYGCLFQSPTFYEEAVLELEVAGLGSTPHLSVDGYQDGGIHVVCESAGWYPEPQVLWRDLSGQRLAPVMEKISQQADGLFDTHIAAVITDTSKQNLSCSVLNPHLGQEKTAKLHIADVFLPRTSPYQVALSVTLAGVFFLILLASYCFWKQHRAKGAQQAKLKQEIRECLLLLLLLLLMTIN